MAVKMTCLQCSEIVNLSDNNNIDFIRGRVRCPNFHSFDLELTLARTT